MEIPSSENAEHPTIISNDVEEHPSIISDDAAEDPTSISNDAAEHPTVISNDAVEHPTVISNDVAEHPTTISNDAVEHPTVISNEPAEHPTAVSDDGTEHLTVISEDDTEQHPATILKDADDHHEDMVHDVLSHRSAETKHEIDEEEVKQTLEAIASTGKFWHDWEKLRSMLSFRLKQVLSEYPEAKFTTEQQSASLAETFEELGKRLDEALFSFVEGPPFTLQRLCEILLAARSIYPNLSKLALALEKNLSVTSTLAISINPCPQTITQKTAVANKSSEEPELHSGLVQNGIEPAVEDRDEIMAEVEEVADIGEDMTIDMDALEGIVGGSSETNSTPLSRPSDSIETP